jgi:hypothetical protein
MPSAKMPDAQLSSVVGPVRRGEVHMSAAAALPDETRKYLEAHPEVAEELRRAEKVYRIFGQYLNLTQSRIIIHESGASTSEADLSAPLLRTNF